MKKLSLVVLISGSGSNLQAIIDAIESAKLQAEIKAVISNRPEAYGLSRAQQHNIPTIGIDHQQFTSREQFDLRLQQEIDALQPDIIVLAGYMRILTTGFIDHFFPRILNIHPSLLPKYQGLHTHQRALENHDRIHGVSIHIVTAELDSGPVILQGQFDVTAQDDSDSLQQKAHALEHKMYPLVLSWLSQQRLLLTSGQPIFDDETIQQPLSLDNFLEDI